MTRIETIGNATHIYALCDEAGQVRYIGKTVRTIDQRLSQHRTAAKRSRLPVGRWLGANWMTAISRCGLRTFIRAASGLRQLCQQFRQRGKRAVASHHVCLDLV